MQAKITEGGKKIQLLYVLWVLENFSDKDNTLKQDDIVDILEKRGYRTERKSIARDLKLLLDFGYKIHGIEPELDKDGNERPMKRGAIWLEREFSDEQLSLLLNSVAYNVFVEKNNKEELLNNIISLGSKTFKEKHNAKGLLTGGRIYQVEGATLLVQLKEIEKAIEKEKRIRFKYASKLKRDGDNLVYERDKEHVVSPYWIVSKNGNLYLVCYNHGENKIWNYRIDKIKEVTMIKSSAMPKTDTELKNISVGTYVSKHPNMFTGDPISIELRVDKSRLGHIYETFSDIIVIQENANYITVKVTCGELDMFYWAIQYGGFVEVLKPQSLRDKIRTYIEGIAMRYIQHDGDKYTEAIKATENNGDLDLSGIDLTSRTAHEKLEGLKTIKLSDNKISDISFLKEFKRLNIVTIANNPIKDLSALEDLENVHTVRLENLPVVDLTPLTKMKNLRSLSVNLGREVDYKAINDMKNLKVLTIPENYSYYLNWDYIGKNMPDLEVRTTRYKPKEEAIRGGNTTSAYPLILFKEAIGYNIELTCSDERASSVADELLDKLCGEEKEVATMFYKKGYNKVAISEDFNISVDKVSQVLEGVKEKITHPAYNKKMEECVKVKKPTSTNAMEKLREIIGMK